MRPSARCSRTRSARAREGHGSLLLLSGEAGVGKTRLAGEAAAAADVLVLRGAASSSAATPHGPLVAVLRDYLRGRPGGLDDLGPLRAHLALLLPELGEPAAGGDRATIFEAVRRAFEAIGPALVVLDDLQWSDEATLSLLGGLAPALAELPVLVIGAYRSDGLPRDHMLRWLRNELRRGGHLQELALAPLDAAGTGELLAVLLPDRPSPALVRALHDRTQGLPFFVEELARALEVSGRLQAGPRGLELGGEGEVPLPDTVRDAVLMSAVAVVGAGARRRRGGRGRGPDVRPPARGRPGARGRAGRAATPRRAARRGRRARRLPPRAELGGVLRRRAVAAPPRAAPGARGGARGGRRAEHGDRDALARRARRAAGA